MSAEVGVGLVVGARLAYDGRQWTVVELAGTAVTLVTDGHGLARQVDVGHLLAASSTRLLRGTAEAEPIAGVGAVLDDLSDAERERLAERVAHVQEVRTGYRLGSAELALPAEPRPEYAPGLGRLRRYEAKAAELGVGVRTLRRWVQRFDSDGPAGLVADRWQRRRVAGPDPRWLDTARAVLAEHTEASTPTQDHILARIAARLDAEHGAGQVPVPGQTRARALLKEISRGTSAFGGAKSQTGDRGPAGGSVWAAAGVPAG